MKAISLTIIIALALSISCHAQIVHVAESIRVNLPAGTYKMTKQQVNSLTEKRTSYQLPEKLTPQFTYNVNGITLNLYNVNHESTNLSLPAKKRFLDNLAGLLKRNGNNTYTSVIKNFGDNQALITHKIVSGIGLYDFHLKNKNRTWTFWGNFEYQEADSAKAALLFDEILNNAQFTN